MKFFPKNRQKNHLIRFWQAHREYRGCSKTCRLSKNENEEKIIIVWPKNIQEFTIVREFHLHPKIANLLARDHSGGFHTKVDFFQTSLQKSHYY